MQHIWFTRDEEWWYHSGSDDPCPAGTPILVLAELPSSEQERSHDDGRPTHALVIFNGGIWHTSWDIICEHRPGV